MAASVQQRIAFGERAGQKVRRPGLGFGYEGEAPTLIGTRCASRQGFSLNANTQVLAHRRDQLERLIRSTARGTVSLEHLEHDTNSDLVYTCTHPWSDGATGIRLSPLELLEKLAVLVPLPRVHLVRSGGCLAPHSHLAAPGPHPLAMEACGTPTRFVAVSHAARSRSAIVASTARPAVARAACVPEGCSRLLAVCCSLHTRVQPSVAVTVLTVLSSCPACARASQSGWPRSAARHPTPGMPGSARPPAACLLPAVRPAGRLARSDGLCPVAPTTPRVRSPRDCGNIAFAIPIRRPHSL
jgi:hypothetical protein